MQLFTKYVAKPFECQCEAGLPCRLHFNCCYNRLLSRENTWICQAIHLSDSQRHRNKHQYTDLCEDAYCMTHTVLFAHGGVSG